MKPKRKNKPGQGRKAEGRVGKMIYMRPAAWKLVDAEVAGKGDTRGKAVERKYGVPDQQNPANFCPIRGATDTTMENDDQAPDVGKKDGLAGGDLHGRIMALPCEWPSFAWSDWEKQCYVQGCYETRDAAAKLAAAVDGRVRELEDALRLLWTETVLSGNNCATDYGWPEARRATLAALEKDTRNEPANKNAVPQGEE